MLRELIRGLLQSERARRAGEAGSSEGAGRTTASWAPSHTAAVDDGMRPGLVLAEVACGADVSCDLSADLSAVPGRPMYKPLLVYSIARAARRLGSLEGRLGEWTREQCDRTEPGDGSPALRAWWALARAMATPGDVATVERLDRHVAAQRASGEFLDSSPYDSPDLHWFDELVLLHALTSYAAVLTAGERREPVVAAVERAAAFHLAETQPDHATSQPWAVHAFALRPETSPLAELLLHGAMAQNMGRLDTVGQILLADALIGLEALGVRE